VQFAAHWPWEHTSPFGHACPQAPQFALSVWVSTQTPLQFVPTLEDAALLPQPAAVSAISNATGNTTKTALSPT
jgi:hypothetical protein